MLKRAVPHDMLSVLQCLFYRLMKIKFNQHKLSHLCGQIAVSSVDLADKALKFLMRVRDQLEKMKNELPVNVRLERRDRYGS